MKTSQMDPMIEIDDNQYQRCSNVGFGKQFYNLSLKKNSVIAAGVYDPECKQLVYKKFSSEDERRAWMDQLNAKICEFGVPDNFVTLPDGSFILGSLIKSGAIGKTALGTTVELYGYRPSQYDLDMKEKPILTALVESREVAHDFLKSLAKRLNKAQ